MLLVLLVLLSLDWLLAWMSFGWAVGSGARMGAAGWEAVSSLTLSSDALSNASSRTLVASVTAATTAAAVAVNCASVVSHQSPAVLVLVFGWVT